MQRIVNLSHNDLDGIASAIAIRTAHPEDHVKTELVSIGNIHYNLKRALEARIPWDRIILSDISIKLPTSGTVWKDKEGKEEALVRELETLIKSYVDNGGEFVVIDHHETAIPMKFYYNAELHPDSILQINDDDGNPIAGSELAAVYMVRKLEQMEDTLINAEVSPLMDDDSFSVLEYDINTLALFIVEFCRIAGDLDVWRDPYGFGGKLALALDLMDDPYGAMEDFQALITVALANGGDFEAAVNSVPIVEYYYNMASNKLAGALAMAEKSIIEHSQKLHQIESRFFASHCADKVYSRTQGVVLITYPTDPTKISFRRHKDINIHLGQFCKKFGGAGHAMAAGMSIPQDLTIEDVVDEMLLELEKLS